jgi:hypothetical protein
MIESMVLVFVFVSFFLNLYCSCICYIYIYIYIFAVPHGLLCARQVYLVSTNAASLGPVARVNVAVDATSKYDAVKHFI